VNERERLVGVLGRGVLEGADEPVVHVDDLGLTRGDGCFDATRLVTTAAGETHADHLDAHLARFARSAAALELTFDRHGWHELIHKAVASWSTPGEAVLRVMLTRGRESGGEPTGLLTITPIDPSTLRARSGISVATLDRGHASDAFTDAPWLLGGVKTLSYAINVAAGREAHRRGVDDVLFVSTDGFALEAPRSALVWRVGKRLTTTRHEGTGILASITQAAVFRGAAAAGIETSYDLIALRDLVDVDGAWLASSGRLVAPIRTLDGAALAVDDGWSSRLNGWFEAAV
jgi:4-amino-4-deoxychorismate lyase